MTHKIKSITSKEDFHIEAIFFNGEIKKYDMENICVAFPQFKLLETDRKLFDSVKVDAGGYGISWNDQLDLDAETIWEDGILISIETEPDLNHLLAYHLAFAREQKHMTQKELAEKTGIYQADISKIERGIGNPSLATLNRLAKGLGADLKIDFIFK